MREVDAIEGGKLDGALAWRSQVSLRLLRGMFFIFVVGGLLLCAIALSTGGAQGPLLFVVLAAALGIERGSGELLLVEDDPMVSLTAVTTLKSFGYTVTQAPDGQRALELVRENPGRFRLTLLDLRMPGLSGEATFDALRELDRTLRIVIWSGYGADQDISAMLERGAVAFVQKPYSVPELSRTIARALRAP